MTKTFDEICNGILGEMITAPNPQKPTATQPNQQQPAPNTGAPAAVQNNASQQTNTPDEITKAFETLNKHVANNPEQAKAVAALQQLLTAQQQNAANKPA